MVAIIWALVRENLSSGFVNNNGADQPAQTDQRLLLLAFWKVLYLKLLQAIFHYQGSKIALNSSYLRVPWAAGQVKILIFLVKIIFFPCMPIFL